QDKYVAEILKKFGFSEVKTASTPMETSKPLLKDENGQETMVSNFTTEAVYVAASSCCGHVLWIQNQLLDYGRSDLCFDDAEGTACLLNEAIFKGLARMGAKTTAWNEFSSTMASAIICLADNQKFNFSKHKEMYVISSHTKKIFANMRRIGEDFSGMVFYTSLQEHVLELQEAKDAQAKEIAALKKKVSKLNKWRKSRSGGLRRLKKFELVRRVKSSMEKDGLDDETHGRTNDDEMFGVNDLAREEVVEETTTDIKDSATPTTNVTEDEITMAQALAALKSVKPKVVVQEQEMSTTILAAATKVTTVVPTLRSKEREREEFSEVQKARLLVELIEKRKKHFAALRTQEKRNKPPTKTQMKSKMSTYLRHMGGYKQSHLKRRSFDEIKELFEREMRIVNDFVTMDLEVDENVEPVVDDSKELRKRIEIVPDDGDEVLIEATPISSRSPTIIDYKIHKEGKKTCFKIIRADDNSQVYQTFEKMFKNFNREDLDVLTLKTMFEHHVKDTIWKYQQGLAKSRFRIDSESLNKVSILVVLDLSKQRSFCDPMESLSPQVVGAAKLPIHNPNEFNLWKMRIEQYFLMTNYSLWELILNGDSPTPTRIVDGVVQVIAPTTIEQRLAKKNELKASDTLLMALPDKHKLKFNIHKDAKSLMEVICTDIARNTRKEPKPNKNEHENGKSTQEPQIYHQKSTMMSPRQSNHVNNEANPTFTAAVARAVADLLPTLIARITNDIRQNENNRNSSNRRNGRRGPASPTDEAENWIAHIEKIFEVLGCDDQFKARLATYKLEGDAHSWWRAYKQTKGAGETSTDFIKRFLRLAGFLRAKVGTQEEQAKHFKWGLNDFVLDIILNTEFIEVAQVVNAARNIEIFRDISKNEGSNKRDRDGHRIRPSETPSQGSNQIAYDRRDSERYGNNGRYGNRDRYGSDKWRSDRQGSERQGNGSDKRGTGTQRAWRDRDQQVVCLLGSPSHPSILLEQRRILFLLGVEVVEKEEGYYPLDSEGFCWEKEAEKGHKVLAGRTVQCTVF
nr:hypothetical protein [Tanacetum cinerariifolium]